MRRARNGHASHPLGIGLQIRAIDERFRLTIQARTFLTEFEACVLAFSAVAGLQEGESRVLIVRPKSNVILSPRTQERYYRLCSFKSLTGLRFQSRYTAI